MSLLNSIDYSDTKEFLEFDRNSLGSLVSINISGGGIPKTSIPSVRLTTKGLQGDGHHHEKHNNPLQAVCLWDVELLGDLCKEGFPLSVGTIGENLTLRDVNIQKLLPGNILEFSGGVILELTKERKPCYVLDAINPKLKESILGRCGYYAKVISEGILAVEETIKIK